MLPSQKREMLQHIPVVSCPTVGPVEPGGSRDKTGDKVTAWPGPCCSLLLPAVAAHDPAVRPLCSHLRSWLGLRAPGEGKLPAEREQVRAGVGGVMGQECPG